MKYVCMYVHMYIHLTLTSMGSLVKRAYRHDVHVVALTQMQVLYEWILLEFDQFLCYRART